MTQIKLVTTQIEQASEPIVSDSVPATNVAPTSLSAIHFLGFIAIWGTAVWAVAKGSKISPRKQTHLPQLGIPCRNCRFFDNNYYLKCAVNPKIAMTQNAIDCPDYCSSRQKNRWIK